jgi:hypothetical protein
MGALALLLLALFRDFHLLLDIILRIPLISKKLRINYSIRD